MHGQQVLAVVSQRIVKVFAGSTGCIGDAKLLLYNLYSASVLIYGGKSIFSIIPSFFRPTCSCFKMSIETKHSLTAQIAAIFSSGMINLAVLFSLL
jgi:hypothetical protein